MNRTDKIALLKGLQAGTGSIKDFKPKELIQRVGYHPTERFSINGNFVDQATFEIECKKQISLFGPLQYEVDFEDYDPSLI